MENFGVGLLGGVVLVDPETGQPYRPVDGGGTGVADWSTLTGKPAVMGVGATQAEARTAIGAGVSNVASVDDLTDSTTVGRAVVKAASQTAARIATNCEVIGAASALMTTHLAAADPHPGYLTPAEGNAAYATAAQGTLAGTAVQPAGLTKAAVGLGSVDNTADTAKPVSTAQQTALNLKANLASPTFTGTVSGVTANHVGLGNVNNTSDASKPVSTATQTALDAKVDSLADLAVLLVALSAGAGMDMPIAYATAYALGSRPAAPTNWKFRIYGGLLADPDPAWMIAGDYRQIPAS